ncbi:MAG: hypothetical protein H7A40_05710 [Chlamydiales bacterium]|nr:hypothetical protein [Chlamydiales bacterium]
MSTQIPTLSGIDLMNAIGKAVESEQALGVVGQQITNANLSASQSLINQTSSNTGKFSLWATIGSALGSIAGVFAIAGGIGMAIGSGLPSAAQLGARVVAGFATAGKGVTDGISAHYKADIDMEQVASSAAGKAGKSASDLTQDSMKEAGQAAKAESAVLRQMTYTRQIV